MAGAAGKAAAQVNTRSRSLGREDLAGGFFVLTEHAIDGAPPRPRPTGDDDDETDRDWNAQGFQAPRSSGEQRADRGSVRRRAHAVSRRRQARRKRPRNDRAKPGLIALTYAAPLIIANEKAVLS
ncbi:hypothetical protein MESS2_1080008 [Mesorhizobium metallidurans STM 2683]|uniref:Uncharacterized protein n=1 Tax=Mesorhizobium metallidurans STM 2683 TaxID=1297569 RepID=M5EHA2_9HYPH|nr:hypothetical protein MESS2_1080008 [Mesorhizobium metallidurans STM 2683]